MITIFFICKNVANISHAEKNILINLVLVLVLDEILVSSIVTSFIQLTTQ